MPMGTLWSRSTVEVIGIESTNEHLVLSGLCVQVRIWIRGNVFQSCVTMLLTLVDISLGVVGELVLLVAEGIDGSVGTSAQLGVGVLGDLLVDLLGGSGTSALDGLSDVVDGVLEVVRRLIQALKG